jgi:UDP-glucose 4-epimerase
MTFARYFVIGGAGFIGSHLVERLTERGPVTVFDDLSSGTRDNLARALECGTATLVEASAHDVEALVQVMRPHDVVFHLGEPPADERGRFVERDLTMTANVLEAMRRVGARQILYASSGEVYGSTCEYCSEHDAVTLPQSAYGAAKLADEALIGALAREHGLQAWIFRLGEVVGPRSRRGPLIDVVRALTASRDAVIHEDPDGARPFIHVDDCIEGMVFAFDRATGPFEVFNLGPGDYTAMRRLVDMCRAVLGLGERRVRWQQRPRAGDSALQRRLDASKLDALGWQTTRSSDEAVREALRAIAYRAAEHAGLTPSRFAEL